MFLRRSLAHMSYIFFCRYIWGACPPPPPIPKSWLRYCPSLQKWLPFFLFFLLAYQLVPPEMRTLFMWGIFFWRGGGGGGSLSDQNFGAPHPPVPPYWSNPSYATGPIHIPSSIMHLNPISLFPRYWKCKSCNIRGLCSFVLCRMYSASQ